MSSSALAHRDLQSDFFDACALLCVDIQEGTKSLLAGDEDLPKEWAAMGFSSADVNSAVGFAYDIALPNAIRVADACHALGLPRVFVHWGYRFADGMDLDPLVRGAMLQEHGRDYTRWSGHIDQAGSRVAAALGVRATDYVVPKTGQDAFNSSTLPFILRNLDVKRLLMMGGHTGACLGRTGASALAAGYEVCVIEDATNDARESARIPNLERFGLDHRVSTERFLSAVAERTRAAV